MDRFDVIVIGAGPAGEVLASRLPDRGMRVALIERELVGGECAYWACIPSKTLLRPPEIAGEGRRAAGTATPSLDFRRLAEYRDFMVRELDDSKEIASYREQGVEVIKGIATLTGAGEVEVAGRVLRSERIAIATGSGPAIPDVPGLEQTGYWTNREATTLSEVPGSAIVLGGGPVGIELAQLLSGFGTRVTLVEAGSRLLAREEHRVGELIADALRAAGVELHLEAELTSVRRDGGLRIAALDTGAELRAEELIVAIGRRPRVEGLGLERAGLDAGTRGIEVDDRCRAAEGIWAVGDVTGVMPFTHVAMYQAKIALADICGEAVRAEYAAVPRVVFCDPEVAAVGMTEEQAHEAGINAVQQRIELSAALARPWTYETEPRGEMSVLIDSERRTMIGAWAVAPLASEWIHYAALAIKAQIPVAVLKDTVAQFPTYTEAYLKALEKLEL